MLLKVWDVRIEAKRFIPASNLNKLKKKGKDQIQFFKGFTWLSFAFGRLLR